MADYRLSVQLITRSKGQSSVASAAYRSASRLVDERTGERHDYTRKQGVIHSEVMTPEATPDWMEDRAQLWNAVEKAERRKDAQLSREVQLSLPHELTADQRKELVREYVQDSFVDMGMIADVNIHAPGKDGDQRNHHAHIMLTLRDITGEGFGNKNRDWNDKDIIQEWREDWARYQNHALERHNHSARVDHRSYEAQGIDREPTHHLGPTAFQMEAKGKASRIGDENRAIANDNKLRAQYYAAEFALEKLIDRKKSNFEKWRDYKTAELRNAQDLKKLDLARFHDLQTSRLEADLEKRNSVAKATIKAEVDFLNQRLEAKGLRKMVRNVFGYTKADQEHKTDMEKTLVGIEKRENEERASLRKRQSLDLQKQAEQQDRRKSRLDKRIKDREAALEKKRYLAADPKHVKSAEFERHQKKPAPVKGLDKTKPVKPQYDPVAKGQTVTPPEPANDKHLQAKPVPAPAPRGMGGTRPVPRRTINATPKTERSVPPEVKPSDAPTLADKKTYRGHVEDRSTKSELSRPWESSIARGDNKRPWESDLVKSKKNGKSPSRSPKPPSGDKS